MNKITNIFYLPLICLALALTCSCRGTTTIIIPTLTPLPPLTSDDDYELPSMDWMLSWSDEFDGSAIDSSIWTHELGDGCPSLCGWGNDELETYTASEENSFIADGKLVIQALYNGGIFTSRGSYTSARMISKNKYSFQYGLVVARMKAPYGRGIWPAIWLLGENIDNVGWPGVEKSTFLKCLATGVVGIDGPLGLCIGTKVGIGMKQMD